MKTLRWLLVLAFCLAGCATAVSTPAATASVSTATASAPTVAATATVPLPTATAQPTPAPATSTPDAWQQEQTAVLPLVAPCDFANQAISYSPSKIWVIVTCQGVKPEDGLTTKVVRLDGSQQWSLSFNETYLKPYRTGDANLSALLQKAFLPTRWTKNEDFVYLAVQTANEDTAFKGYDGLFRLDLTTGKLRSVLKPAVEPFSATYAFKFSPSGTRLAYINQSVHPLTIVLINTGTGEENKITLDARFSQGGGLLWSQNEQQLIVSVLEAGKNGGNALIRFDLATMQNEYLIKQSANTYLPLDWIDEHTIYAENYPGNWVYFDLDTKEFRPASAPITSTTAQILASKLAFQPTPTSATGLPVEITDAKGVVMRLVPAGEFVMGGKAEDTLADCQKYYDDCQLKYFADEDPPHIVQMDSYYMDVYEVTNGLYKTCVTAGVCTPPQDTGTTPAHTSYYGNANYDNYPVVNVSWDQAQTYCTWRGARLPTEAEWEKAARGTDGRTYPWGKGLDRSFTNFDLGDTTPVGKYEKGKSPYGLYDMAGNVWEWVADWYSQIYYKNSPQINPTGPDSGQMRARRGGNFYGCDVCSGVYVTNRGAYFQDLGDNSTGFRCASTPQTNP